MGNGATEQLQQQLNAVENNLAGNLKQITQEIKDLIDDDDNTKFELAGKLNTEVANALKDNQDFANSLQKIIDGINTESLSQEDKNSLTQLTNFIKPYITTNQINNFSGDDISINDDNGNFVHKFDNQESNPESTESDVNNLIDRLNALNRQDDPIIKGLKASLNNIKQVLEHPSYENTRLLQEFLYKNLSGKDQEEFKNKNKNNNGERDGKFGKATLAGLNIFIGSTTEYINNLETSINIQTEHDNTVVETAEADRINNLKINKVMEPLEQYNNEKIQALLETISGIESWNDSDENKETLNQELLQKKQEAQDIQDLLDNWDEQKRVTKNYLKHLDGDRYTSEDRDLFNNMFSDKAKEQKEKQLSELNGEIDRLTDILDGKKNEKISEKLGELEGEYKNMITSFNNDIIGWQAEIDAIPRYLKDQNVYKIKIANLNEQIKNKKNDIKNILEFFGWDDNCNLDNNTLGNTEYLNYKLSHESTEVNLENCINTISINDNFQLRGDWKGLEGDALQEQKDQITNTLNKYIDQNIRKYLPENVRIVLDLAQKALTSETNGDDKNVGVYALENKLAELGAMPRIANEGNNGVDGKFGPKTFDALTNYIETSLKENAEIQENGINVTLRGARSKDKWDNNTEKDHYENYDKFMIAKKGEIREEINKHVKNWENLSFNKKKILTLTKAALNAVSDGEDKSDEVKALETELGMPDSPSNADIHDSIDGRFGPITYDALIKYLETPDN